MANNQLSKKDFRIKFPDEAACANYILGRQLAKGFHCKCGNNTFYWIDKQHKFKCKVCTSKPSVFKGTIFYHSHIKLMDWFEVIYMFAVSKNGISAKEIERTLGCAYDVAWKMLHQIRNLLVEDTNFARNSQIEIDECYVGGSPKNWSKEKRKEHKERVEQGLEKGLQGRSTQNKEVIVGFYERETKKVILRHVDKGESVNQKDLLDFMLDKFTDTNIIYTDEATIYSSLYQSFEHYSVDHSQDEYVYYKKTPESTLKVSTNNMEAFWAIVKRGIKGSYIHVSTKHFDKYLKEFSFKFNNRNNNLFNCILNTLV